MLIAVAVLVSFLAAWILGADLSRLAELRLRGLWLVFAAPAVQLAVFTPWSPTLPDTAQVALHLASYALLLAFLALNIQLPGLRVVAVGFACNTAVIFANGGRMPVLSAAWKASGADTLTRTDTYNNVVIADDHTRLSWLGDILPLPPHLPLATALSIGDILLIVGLTAFTYRTCGPRRHHSRPALNPLRKP